MCTASGAQYQDANEWDGVGAYANSWSRGMGKASMPVSDSGCFLQSHGLGSESEGYSDGEEDLPGP